MDAAHKSLRRLCEMLKRSAISEDDFDPWTSASAFIFPLVESGKGLPAGALPLLVETSSHMSLPAGASLPALRAAIERTFGPCPWGEPTLTYLSEYLRGQLNGAFEAAPTKKKGPALF